MMKLLTTSAAIAVLMLAGAGAASACEWQKQSMAQASAPPAETTVASSASTIDPVVLAEIEKTGEAKK
jgi:hypothetical protein